MKNGIRTRAPMDSNGDVLRELAGIKRLLAVLMLKLGTPQSEIALALQMDRADVSRILPARKNKPFIAKGKE